MTTHDDRLLVVVTTWLGVLLTMTLALLGVYAGRQAWHLWRMRT